MNKKEYNVTFIAIFLLLVTSVVAQSGNQNQVSTVFAVLTKSVESKSATVNQELSLLTISDVMVNGRIVIPKGSKLLGHVAQAATKGKDEPQSLLAMVIDMAVTADGAEIPLHAIVAAVAAPRDNSLTSDPAYGMMHSNEPKMVGSGAASSASAGGISSNSRVGSTAPVATAELKGRMDSAILLNEDSQGAIGYEGLSLSWRLASPPPVTVFASKNKNLKLATGTQMLLRMASPRSIQ